MKSTQVERLKLCDDYRRLNNVLLLIRKAEKGKKTRLPLEELLRLADEFRTGYHEWKRQHPELFRTPRDAGGKYYWKRNRTPEERARGQAILEANLKRQQEKIQSKREYNEFIGAWRKKWSHLGMARKRSKRKQQKKREAIIKASTSPDDRVLRGQLNHIMFGACVCYWCQKLMPNGGTVDHIVSLAKGGSHASGNICAACHECNSKKNSGTPEEAGLTGTLL